MTHKSEVSVLRQCAIMKFSTKIVTRKYVVNCVSCASADTAVFISQYALQRNPLLI
jgi:hypothetical protein